MAIIAQAPVLYASPYTTLTGTTNQLITVNQTGVTAGFASATTSTFALTLPAEAMFNGMQFRVKATGWVLAHGTSQTLKIGFYWQNPNATSPSYAAAFTQVASGTLTAGTYYAWSIDQGFIGDNNSGNLIGVSVPVVVVNAPVTISTIGTTLTGINFGTQSYPTTAQTGIVTTQPNSSVQFAIGLTNSVADTTETIGIYSFYATLD